MVPTSGSYVPTKKMLWHLLTESSFTPSTSKPFNSKIADKLRDGAIDGILVGDSGYACRAYLMTPVLKPKNSGKGRYNTAHRRTRCVIERCYGLLIVVFCVFTWDCAPPR
ncbi:unnamed protein product [Porites evermanni]|uniref:DDE Tnp4 domain-containing protein n=1 Tax=Porites evermanni TaxID=104178 RepID=A0ABN8LUY3_9CNID|nr:unnamed protein product [Porites evermanni]